jgi:hypothetical protein
MFGYKHLGINVIADRVEEIGERTAVLHFKEGQGVVNGGHGLKILRDLQADPKHGHKMPPNFIKVTVIAGLDRLIIPEISGASNSSVQVRLCACPTLPSHQGQTAIQPVQSPPGLRNPGHRKVAAPRHLDQYMQSAYGGMPRRASSAETWPASASRTIREIAPFHWRQCSAGGQPQSKSTPE